MKTFETVIGLEVHAQIISETKMFSTAPSSVFGQEANSCVSFVDIAFPGMLPVLNDACVYQAVKLGLALKGIIQETSILERKHYFYPDNPAGYQISQYKTPLVQGGQLTIHDSQGQTKVVRLQRIHIEQDAGKSLHDQDPHMSYIDFNRAGVGLMEIVSHPDLNTPEEVVDYVKRLRCIMRYLGVCYGDMEKGQLRVDANISVRRPGESLGVRVELKNMNSLRFLQQALHYEIKRQIGAIEKGEVILQETRTFDISTATTRPMRVKEVDYDYFYFPDPDLLPLVLDKARVAALAASLPESPEEKHRRFVQDYALSPYDADLLVEDSVTAHFFEAIISLLNKENRSASELYKAAAHWITGELFAALHRRNETLETCKITPEHIAELVLCVNRKDISLLSAKEIFAEMCDTGNSCEQIMREKNLKQVSDDTQLYLWIRAVLTREHAQVQAYLSGKEKLFAYFVGQVMKESQGKGNPQHIQYLMKLELEAYALIPQQ